MSRWLHDQGEGADTDESAAAPTLMPSAPPLGAGWPLLCLALAFLVYVACIPRILLYSNPPTGDQPFYLMDAVSLVQDHDLNLANNYVDHDFDKFYALAPHPPGFVGISAPYPLPPQLAVTPARPASEAYSYHLPGLGIVLAPAWLVGSWFSLWWPATIVLMCLIGALVAVNAFLLAYEVTGRVVVALAVWASMAFSGPILSYSLLIFTELPCGLLLIYSFRRLALGWCANGPVRRLLIGLSIAYIPWLAWRCLPISIGLLLFAFAQWRRAEVRTSPTGDRAWLPSLTETLPVLLPIIISACLLVTYSLFLFGQPYPSAAVAGQGTPVFHWPWHGSHELMLFVTGLFAIFFDRQWGLLPFTPVYLLAAVGLALILRRGDPVHRRLVLWGGVITVPYALLIASFDYWGGLWCPPARYLATLVPLLAAPLAVSLIGRSLLFRAIYGALSAVGFGFIWLMLYNPHLMFPVSRSYLLTWLATDPDSPLHLNLLPLLPAFAWPDPATQAFVTGRVVAVAFVLVLGSYLLQHAPAAESDTSRHGSLSFGTLATFARSTRPWLLCASTVLAGWYIMNSQFLQRQTVLTEQHRWTLSPAPVQPTAATFWKGHLYVADYAGGAVDELNVRAGTSTSLRVTSAGRLVRLFHPGSVAVGPNGLLYVLNNGPGNQALYVLRPTGQLIRTESLTGKFPISVGMALIGRSGLYVTDMTAGAVRRYGPGGGNELSSWVRPGGVFNNLAGVIEGPDGLIYAAETSANRVLAFNSSGQVVQTYDVACSPHQLARSGRWLDVTCGTGLISIDTSNRRAQASHVAPNDQSLTAPSALAYGPDGLLYVVDGSSVVAYTVNH